MHHYINSLRVLFFIFLLPFSLQAQSDCKVFSVDLQGTYEGECKRGLAHGQGKAVGRHSFEGNWKRGKPHGRGIYTFEEGKFYEGSIKNGVADGQGTLTLPDGTTQAGYWEKGEYLGSFLQPYVFATLPLETNYDLKRTGSDKNQVTFKTTLQGLPISPDNLDLVASSGVPFQFADKFGLENVEFPVTIDCTYKVLQGFNTVDIKFRFTIYQAGEWTMTMRH